MKFTYTIRKPYRYIMVRKEPLPPPTRVFAESSEGGIPDAPSETELKDAGENARYWVNETRTVDIPWYVLLKYWWKYAGEGRYQLIRDLVRKENEIDI